MMCHNGIANCQWYTDKQPMIPENIYTAWIKHDK